MHGYRCSFKFHMLTFGTEIVILYIAEECVRLRHTPLLLVTSYITDGHRDRGIRLLFNKKIVGVYYILCVVVYAYYEDVQSIEIPTIVQL